MRAALDDPTTCTLHWSIGRGSRRSEERLLSTLYEWITLNCGKEPFVAQAPVEGSEQAFRPVREVFGFSLHASSRVILDEAQQ